MRCIYIPPTHEVLTLQDTPKVLSDPGNGSKEQILRFMSGQNFPPPI